jgi:predicted amidohydrolase YtcJ
MNARSADVIFVNGAITTLDPARPQAEAVAVSGGRFIAVGTDADIRKHASEATTVIDLEGRRAVPGLIDAHCHPIETLWMKDDWVDARFPDTNSVATTLGKLRERAAKTAKGLGAALRRVSSQARRRCHSSRTSAFLPEWDQRRCSHGRPRRRSASMKA